MGDARIASFPSRQSAGVVSPDFAVGDEKERATWSALYRRVRAGGPGRRDSYWGHLRIRNAQRRDATMPTGQPAASQLALRNGRPSYKTGAVLGFGKMRRCGRNELMAFGQFGAREVYRSNAPNIGATGIPSLPITQRYRIRHSARA